MCSSYPVGLAPSITSLSVTTGAVGAVVTITGTNFGATQGSSTVSFSGTAATVISWSATSIATTVPSGATTGNVVVFASGVNSNGSSFTVGLAPSITSLSVTTGAVGAPVTITGTNFGATQGSSTVSLDRKSAAEGKRVDLGGGRIIKKKKTSGNGGGLARGVKRNSLRFTV